MNNKTKILIELDEEQVQELMDLTRLLKRAFANANFSNLKTGSHMTVDQLAEYLDRPKSFVYNATYRGAIPHIKRGKRVYFIKEKIDEWLQAGEVEMRTDI
mgnify:FL=1